MGPYIVDFMSFERNLVVELDGGHHADQRDYDGRRTKWLESQGLRVLRFWNGDVLGRIDSVVEAIRLELQQSVPVTSRKLVSQCTILINC